MKSRNQIHLVYHYLVVLSVLCLAKVEAKIGEKHVNPIETIVGKLHDNDNVNVNLDGINNSYSNSDSNSNNFGMPRQLQASANFAPLACNSQVSSSNCTPWPFGTAVTSSVQVPCGTCYTMSNYVNYETISIAGTLNVQGRLEFPNGAKLTLDTHGIIVEGQLDMKSNKLIDGTPDIRILFTSTDDVLFTPHSDNALACGGTGLSCNLGPKPFLVAGGQLTINGLPHDSCSTWNTIASIETSPIPMPTDFPSRPALPTPTDQVCSYFLIQEDFNNASTNKWYGNLGAQESIVTSSSETTPYLHISNRSKSFQGPIYDFSQLRSCILPDVDYYIQMSIKLTPTTPGSTSNCASSGTNCPDIRLSYMNDIEAVRWRTLSSTGSFTTYTDSQWITVKATFRFSQAELQGVFTLFTINGPEPGIDISLDDITIELAPANAFPDPNAVCDNLIVNGSAESMNGFAAPMYPFIKANQVIVSNPQDGSNNPYFTIQNRKAPHDTIAMSLTTGCLTAGSVYTFSSKIKIDSPTDIIPRAVLKTFTDGNPIFDIVTPACPPSSSSKGWITCTSDFTFKEYHSTAPQVELIIFFRDDSSSDAHFDDISFTFKHGSPGRFQLNSLLDSSISLDSCYAPGAQVVFPSQTLFYYSTTSTTIDEVSSTNAINVVGGVTPLPVTSASNPYTAGEVAFVSRNIVFENGDPLSTTTIGPSLVVLNTPGVVQHIQGVEFHKFGVEGVAGRHPIHFKMSGDLTGSVVSHNSIRYSTNRCINIHSTNNVLVDQNVAYETKGHCFALEGSGEMGNVFSNNIGIYTAQPSTIVPGTSDNTPATFYITYPTNTWIGNVAAGSAAYGFWFEFNKLLDGLPHSWVSPLTLFANNKSHSNNWFGIRTSPYGYNPSITATLSNTLVYKNRGQGLFMFNTGNFVIDGGYFADNKINIDVLQDNTITIKNVKIVGISPEYKSLMLSDKTVPNFCNSGGFIGVRLHIREKDAGAGQALLDNIEFSNFDQDCNVKSYAIAMNPDKVRGDTFNTKIGLGNVTYTGFTGYANKINFCDADAAGILDVEIVDGGSLNPTDSTSGYIVSNNQNMITDACTQLSGSCAFHCTDTSAATSLDSFGTKNTSTNNAVIDTGICLTNGGFEGGTSGWKAVNAAGIQIVTGVNGSGQALKITGRKNPATGSAWQDFMSSCVTLDSWYELSADVKMTNAGTDTIFDCNPTIMWYNDPMSCAGISLFRKSTSPPLKEIAFTVGPYNADGWAKLYGTFKVTQDMVADASLGLIVSRAAVTADITIDNILLTPVNSSSVGVTDCSSPLINGDAEIGDHRNWWVYGVGNPNTRIELSLGADGTGYAFKHTGSRDSRNRGMVQKMDSACFTQGSSWIITAKFRYFQQDGTFVACDKSSQFTANSCPVFQLADGGSLAGTIPLLNTDSSEMVVGEWNNIRHTFTVSTAPQTPEYYILLTSVAAGFNYEVDDIQIVPV